MKLNLPNKLTLIRMALVPVFMFFISFTAMNDTASRIIALVIFSLTSFTDMLDGKIARKHNLITDFGKFLDPVADKLLIIGSYLALLVRYRENTVFVHIMFWSLFVIVAREIGVTSLRMIVASKVVVPANIWGKCKTVSQMTCVIVTLLEPIVFGADAVLLSYITIILSAVLTLVSGMTYFVAYFPYINPKK